MILSMMSTRRECAAQRANVYPKGQVLKPVCRAGGVWAKRFLMQQTTIERLGQQGDGIGTDGVFAAFTLPGERVEGDVSDNRMDVVRRLSDSAERVAPVCKHFGTCGGCSLQHASDEFLAGWKQDVIRRALSAQGLETDIRPTDTSPAGARRRAVFSGRRTKKTTVVGFHVRGSEVSFNIEECPLLLPGVFNALPVCRAIVGLGASRKSEIKMSVTHSAAGLDIAVSLAKPIDRSLRVEVAQLAERFDLARLVWNGEGIATRCRAVQVFGGIGVTPPAGAFLQATAHGEAALVKAMQQAVGGASRIVDLFSGCGTFSLPLAQRAAVHAVEGEADMLAALDEGWRFATGLKEVTTETRDLFRRPLVPLELKKYDGVVIDPPRAGAKAQIEELVVSNVARIGAVSCNPATFARDARILTDGGFMLDWVQPVDQFRWSGHVELAARFSR